MTIKGVLLDLGGVVFVGDTPLPGALDAIARLRKAGLPLRFLTNTTRTPRAALLAKLRDMGLALEDAELFTPAMAARARIERGGLAPHLLVHPALEADFANGARGDGPRDGRPTDGRPAVVIGDAGEGFTYAALNCAFRMLMDGAEFLALANNRSFRDADGGLSLDAGPFVAALAFASQREPVILGKPAPDFFRTATDSLGCAPEDTAMIGDDVENDVGGAMALGMHGILVRTGKYRAGDEARIDPPASAVADDLVAAVDVVLGDFGVS